MENSSYISSRVFWLIPPIALGVLVLFFMTSGKQPPVKAEAGEASRSVRVIEIPKVDLIPQAYGYGEVKPTQVWKAVAQVSGRITEMHAKLRNGEIIPKGVLLFRIDPVDYELALAQANAELAELEVQKQNAEASLAIEQRNLKIAQREATRLRKLAQKGTTSKSSADDAERAMLSTRMSVQTQQNTLALIPTQKKLLEAKVLQAERDLQNTEVFAPFNLRVANLQIEKDQFVSTGQDLFEGDSVDSVEATAQVPLSSLRNLFIGFPERDVSPTRLSESLAKMVALKPVLRLDMGTHVATWNAEFVRFSDGIDSDTRTFGTIAKVDKPMDQIIPGYRPPLSKGMFVGMIIQGRIQPGQLIIPRHAIRDSKILVVDESQRLKTVEVKVLYKQGDIAVIEDGVTEGQQIVVSDLIPAVDGMLLAPVVDKELQASLIGAAGGVQ